MYDRHVQSWILLLGLWYTTILASLFAWKRLLETKSKTLKDMEEIWKE
ncbi:hypothetical protein [Dysgonomonas reticulitermitis]